MMISTLKKILSQLMTSAALVILSGLPTSAQTATPVTAPTTTSPGQTDHSALPDGPTPIPTPAQSQDKASEPAANSAPQAQLTVLEDTLIRVMTNEPVSSKRAKEGTPLLCTLSEDVFVGDVLAIPRGATIHGMVVKSRSAGVLTGSNELTLKLVSLNLGARTYLLYTYQFKVTGTSKTKPTETKAVRGAFVGAIVGGAVGSPSANGGSTEVGRLASMSAGAALGAGVGTIVSAATPGPGISIPSEAQVDFYLAAPITVPPVSDKDAARLAQRLHPGGPSLYVRDDIR